MNATLEVTDDDFAAFFESLTGRAPRAYQIALAQRFRAGEPPGALVASTGLGKTLAVIVGWLWALAMDIEYGPGPRRVPLRLFIVVDRRVVVDGTFEAAQRVVHALAESTDPAVEEIRTILLERFPVPSLAPEGDGPSGADLIGGPVEVIRLRGNLDDRPENTRSPVSPLIAVGTIDLVLSRLLYRAYLTSPRRRSIEAALVGADSLIVLDEAHLVDQARTTLDVLQRHQRVEETWFDGVIPARQVMTMTATPSTAGGDDVLQADLEKECALDPALAAQLERRRAMPYRIVPAQGTLVEAMQHEVALMRPELTSGRLLLVFTNLVKDARALALRLQKETARWDVVPRVHLVTGGMPEHATTRLLESLAPFMSGAPGRAEAPPTIIVTTSTLEVGADLDADWLVTAPCSGISLQQRLGRVNRIGARDGGSVVVIALPDASKDPVHGDAAEAVLKATASSATVGEAMAVLTDAEDSHTFAPPSPDPAVLPHHVFAAYRRTGGSRNDLPVAPWLRAIDGTGAEVSIVFRAAVRHVDDDGALMAHLRAIGPAAMREAWTVSLGSARSLLTPSWMQHLIVMDPATLELRREGDRNALRPGDVLFLPPPVTNPLLGFGDLERDVSGTVVVSRGDWSHGWNVRECARAVTELVQGGMETLLLPTTEADLVELLPDEALLATVRTELNDDPQRPWIQVRPVRTTDRESPCAVPLDVHGRDVGEVAGQWARRLGLPRAVCEDIALAGRWHDAGKSAPWQSRMLAFTLDPETGALVPGEEGAPALGKSALPRAMWRRAARLAGVPDGFRHEAASAALFDAAVTAGAAEPHDAAFVRHLILSHHGHFRGPGPVVPAPLREAAHLGVYQDPAHPAWHRALSDFRDLERRWGPYTLSLAETILRLADWYVSRKGGTA